VLELLSPSNKLAERWRYLEKQSSFISSRINLVEIDLVRQGRCVFPQAICTVIQAAAACYGVCVFRATSPQQREAYPIGLRQRLPNIRVPLRPSDADARLDLQPLIDQCHERGRYHLLNYRLALDPPLPGEDAAWAEQLLHQHQLL